MARAKIVDFFDTLFNGRDDESDDYNEDYDGEEEYEEEEERVAPSVSSRVRRRANSSNLMSLNGEAGTGMKVVAYKPKDRSDAQHIVDCLKGKRPVVMNLTDLDDDTAMRVFDIVTGAVSALEGRMLKISGKIFIVAPSTVDVICDKDESED